MTSPAMELPAIALLDDEAPAADHDADPARASS